MTALHRVVGACYPMMVIRKLHKLHTFCLLKTLLSADLTELSAEYSQNSSNSQCSFESEVRSCKIEISWLNVESRTLAADSRFKDKAAS